MATTTTALPVSNALFAQFVEMASTILLREQEMLAVPAGADFGPMFRFVRDLRNEADASFLRLTAAYAPAAEIEAIREAARAQANPDTSKARRIIKERSA